MLTSGAPPFLVTAASRMLAVALMAVTYVTISKSNYAWFGAGAILCGALGFIAVARFDYLRERYVVQVPVIGMDGNPLLDGRKRVVQQNLVVRLEAELREDVKAKLADARKEKAGLSVRQFMSGFGPQRVNDPEALWDSALLANTRNAMTITLMCAVLFGVMAVFLAAFTVEVFTR